MSTQSEINYESHQREMTAEPQPQTKPRLGLALSGGAARGMAHIGVLRVLEENSIPIDFIAGSSAGALVGGAYAAGMSLDAIAHEAGRVRWRDVGSMTLSRLGLQSNARFADYLRKLLPVTKFSECRIPFAATATDLRTGQTVVLSDDATDLPFAIRTSCAVPGWYVPITDAQGRQLVDGGVALNIPASVVRDMGADVVMVVDVNAEGAKFIGEPSSAFGVLLQAFMIVQRNASQQQLDAADLVVSPSIGHLRWDEVSRAQEFIAAGATSMQAALAQLKLLLAL